jgi:hypothetical protein
MRTLRLALLKLQGTLQSLNDPGKSEHRSSIIYDENGVSDIDGYAISKKADIALHIHIDGSRRETRGTQLVVRYHISNRTHTGLKEKTPHTDISKSITIFVIYSRGYWPPAV